MFMKAVKGKWIAAVFAAVMGFAAGAATTFESGYINDILEIMGEAEGITLLSLAVTGMLLNAAFFCWSCIAEGKLGNVMAMTALWIKAVLIGLFCRELLWGANGIKVILGILALFGGGCICTACIMDREQSNDRAKRIAVWLCGVTIEGIIMPSVARTWALLFM